MENHLSYDHHSEIEYSEQAIHEVAATELASYLNGVLIMKKKFIDVLTEVVKGKKTMLNFTNQFAVYMDEMGIVKYFFLNNKDFRMKFDLGMEDLLREDEWGYYQESIKQFSFHTALDKMANGDLMRRTWMAQTGAWVYAVHDKLYLETPLTGVREWNPTISDMQANDWVEVKL